MPKKKTTSKTKTTTKKSSSLSKPLTDAQFKKLQKGYPREGFVPIDNVIVGKKK